MAKLNCPGYLELLMAKFLVKYSGLSASFNLEKPKTFERKDKGAKNKGINLNELRPF